MAQLVNPAERNAKSVQVTTYASRVSQLTSYMASAIKSALKARSEPLIKLAIVFVHHVSRLVKCVSQRLLV
jgi:t-SNARE complex subunit (syntaxin)